MDHPKVEKYVFRYGLAALFILGFFAEIVALQIFEIPEASRDALHILLGVLGTGTIGILNFYFGSSKSSDDKTALINGK